MQLDLATVDVGELVTAALEDLDVEGLPVTVGELPPVRADAVQLLVVIQNVLGNAVKHAAGAPIEVTGSVADGVWRLDVADHGPGIAEAERDRVFESFVRLDTSISGSGLGLATCYRVMAAHGGSIELVETPGGGTTARLAIPAPA